MTKRENPDASGSRVVRGGSWIDDQRVVRCAVRRRYALSIGLTIRGFGWWSPPALLKLLVSGFWISEF